MAVRRPVCFVSGKLNELPVGDTLEGAGGGDPSAWVAANGDLVADSFGFIGGTRLVSNQTTAPTSWTKDTTHNDKTMRVVSGTVSSGGSTAFSTVFASRTPSGTISGSSLSIAQLAVHGHTYNNTTGTTAVNNNSARSGAVNLQNYTTSNAGSGDSHDHTFSGSAMDFAVQYADVTIIVKD